ncbi:tubulin binding cofactor A [Cryomyces antarcticus]|uniref:Tubulin-specific chaperone A n=1 Tax=Cryomyces antarcticus TaxID=329879 RepID=A0ABR0M940_9PEZI|nr:tubulin folding cofactor A [Cryomyces antarcticus]KAK5015230.1 tubulin folding cofactor A [Cryomyces antarcticus]KAK5163983.1 hypothetical protein LTR04_002159 [Oleoguttula sp. CCFEE 6159]KAK5287803.1 tubulin folding cofactor A [Cryomyces antarcticus]
MAPSPLAITTSSINRMVKEEQSYHKEIIQQQARITKLERDGGDENAEFQLKQERQALEETKAVFPSLRQRISDAITKLEDQINGAEGSGSEDEITKAKQAVANAKESLTIEGMA